MKPTVHIHVHVYTLCIMHCGLHFKFCVMYMYNNYTCTYVLCIEKIEYYTKTCTCTNVVCCIMMAFVYMYMYMYYRIRGYFRWVDIFVDSTDPRKFQPFKFLAVWVNTWS